MGDERITAKQLSADFTWDETQRGRQAAVLVLISSDSEPKILFTQRARGISQAGQISFPGGSREGQEDPEQTALREACEEVGVSADRVKVLGRIPGPAITRLRFQVVAVVAEWDGDASSLRPDAREVARLLSFPVRDLVDPANRITWEIENGHRGPGFLLGDVMIWGMTAAITDAALRLAGWEQPWDETRIVHVPPEFR